MDSRQETETIFSLGDWQGAALSVVLNGSFQVPCELQAIELLGVFPIRKTPKIWFCLFTRQNQKHSQSWSRGGGF